MLDALREGTRGWIAYVIVAILAIPFALWGIGNYAGFFSSPNVVATIGDANITQPELERAYRNRVQQMKRVQGADFLPENPLKLKEQVLQSVVGNRVLRQYALDSGYRTGTAQLLARIHSMPVFQVDHKFNLKVYKTRVQRSGFTPQYFEHSTRQDMAVQQLRGGLSGSTIVTDHEFKHYVALVNQQRKVSYVTLKTDDFTGENAPSDQAIQAWYNNHKEAFMTPDTVTVAYIELSAKNFENDVKVTDAALRKLYNQNKQRFVKSEQRRAAHILIAPKNDSADALSSAKKKAANIIKKLHDGASFAALAKKYSDDAGSADKKGELGWGQRDDFGKAFSQALFAANKSGDIIGPVKTKYGYHVIKLEGIKKAQQQSFAQVRNKLAQQYRHQQAVNKFYDLQNKLSNLAFDHSDSLKPIQKALGINIKTVANVTRKAGTGIALNEAVRNAAFSDSVYNNNKNKLVQLDKTNVIALRDIDRKPATLKPLEKVKPQIIAILKKRNAQQAAAKKAQTIVANVNNGTSLAAAAKPYKPSQAVYISRADSTMPNALKQAVFSTSYVEKNDAASPTVAGHVQLKDGDYAVFAISDSKPGRTANLSDVEEKVLRQQLIALHAQTNLAAFVSDLKSQSDIQIFKDHIQTY